MKLQLRSLVRPHKNIDIKECFIPICTNCNKCIVIENPCDYWFHPKKTYGRSNLIENFCDDCMYVIDDFDGGETNVCH